MLQRQRLVANGTSSVLLGALQQCRWKHTLDTGKQAEFLATMTDKLHPAWLPKTYSKERNRDTACAYAVQARKG